MSSLINSRTKRFWISTGLSATVVLLALASEKAAGLALNPRIQLIMGAAVFFVSALGFWVTFSDRSDITRRFSLIIAAVILIILGFLFWYRHA
jgi:putative Mn2+ efflux pump MntP